MGKVKNFISGNHIKVIKTNLDPGFRNKTNKFSIINNTVYKYKNVHSCILSKNTPVLKVNYSIRPCAYHGIPKIILSHKMFGIPFYDKDGIYGIPTKDNFIIVDKTHDQFLKIIKIFNSKCIRHVFNSFRYRMSCIEKEAFEFIPDLSILKNINWDFFDSSFLIQIKVGIYAYSHILQYKVLPSEEFDEILIE
ncbi:MAG: hypothetical protein CXT73_04780 [Methanobacteriota archaeon]|nr:MAG: hypothetical protein CXT73_04780 [Euryarchaeota archaeon]